ncbi:MAG TPA: hypothetical protein VJ742_12980 [Nitrososphaera sp.]|nr:hypothetical protein [Nitrososphaera sp.]
MEPSPEKKDPWGSPLEWMRAMNPRPEAEDPWEDPLRWLQNQVIPRLMDLREIKERAEGLLGASESIRRPKPATPHSRQAASEPVEAEVRLVGIQEIAPELCGAFCYKNKAIHVCGLRPEHTGHFHECEHAGSCGFTWPSETAPDVPFMTVRENLVYKDNKLIGRIE